MILVDTSVWIDYLRGKKTVQVNFLDERLAKEGDIVICPIIVQEVLQGIKISQEFNKTKALLLFIPLLESKGLELAIGAANIYRKLRAKGITIRSSNDCLIAWYAIENQCSVLHCDRDFDHITQDTKLKVVSFS